MNENEVWRYDYAFADGERREGATGFHNKIDAKRNEHWIMRISLTTKSTDLLEEQYWSSALFQIMYPTT